MVKRVFLAFEISDEIKDYLYETTLYFRKTFKISWVKKENYHITVRFFGNIGEKEIEGIKDNILSHKKVLNKFKANINGLGAFPSFESMKVFFASCSTSLNIKSNFAFIIDNPRRFKTHITLARIKKEVDFNKFLKIREKIEKNINKEFIINNLTLFESVLTKKGPMYIPIFKFNLK